MSKAKAAIALLLMGILALSMIGCSKTNTVKAESSSSSAATSYTSSSSNTSSSKSTTSGTTGSYTSKDYSSSSKSSTNSSTKSQSSSKDSNSATCPVCGRSTTKSQITWQGMCSSCYKNYKQAQNYKDAATGSSTSKKK